MPNRVVARLGAGGGVDVYNHAGLADVIVDVGGWYSDGSGDGSGTRYTPVSPVRVLDTRPAAGPVGPYRSPFGAGQTRPIPIAGQFGLPAGGLIAVAANVTVTGPSANSFLSLYPDDLATPPLVSDLNFRAGQTVPALAVTRLGAGGGIAGYNLAGTVDVIVDVLGYYS